MGENVRPNSPVFSPVKPACLMSCSGKLSQRTPGVGGLDLSQQGDKAVSQGLPPSPPAATVGTSAHRGLSSPQGGGHPRSSGWHTGHWP